MFDMKYACYEKFEIQKNRTYCEDEWQIISSRYVPFLTI
jgi:hypothetical protein